MKGIVCKTCGYTSLDEKVDICPICHLKNVFEEKEEAYKTSDFKSEKGESKKKHIPSLKVVDKCGVGGTDFFAIRAIIGEIIHPALSEHHITDIWFYLNDKFVYSVSLTESVIPAAVLNLKSGTKGKVQVIENCNVHGKWFNEMELA